AIGHGLHRRADDVEMRGSARMSQAMTGRRIAIVGGAGFIGHNLALALARRGAMVAVVDSLQVNNLLAFSSALASSRNRELYLRMIHERLELLNAAHIPLHVQDARDYHALSRVLTQIDPQVIIHLAAVSHAGRSNKDPFSTFDHSLRTLENALDFARGASVEHFVFLSSSMAYGNFLTPEVAEDHPLNPICIESALAGEPLKVDGDGEEKLDFTYIDDLIEGIALSVTEPAARNEIFNITYGAARPIRDLVEVLKREFGNLKVEHVERDQLMPFRGTLSIDKARQLLGFAPANPIDVGFPKYVKWYRQLMAVA